MKDKLLIANYQLLMRTILIGFFIMGFGGAGLIADPLNFDDCYKIAVENKRD